MLAAMKLILPIIIVALAGCCADRPAPTHAEHRDSFHQAGGQMEKSYDKENPANPGALSEKPKE